MQFRSLIWLVVGAAVGSAATYYIFRNRLEEESSKKLEASIRDMEDYFQVKYSKKPKPEENSYEEDFEDEKEPEKNEPIAYNEIASYKTEEAPKRKEDDRVTLISEDEYREQQKKAQNKPPYTITPREFANENTWYEKTDLIYYASNQILVEDEVEDGEDPVVRDVDLLVGAKNLKRFGEYEEGVVYIRNDNLCVDYCIRRKKGRYSGQETMLDED